MVSLQETYDLTHPIGFNGDCTQNNPGKPYHYEAAEAILTSAPSGKEAPPAPANPASADRSPATTVAPPACPASPNRPASASARPPATSMTGQEVTVVTEGTVYVTVAAAVALGNKVLVNGDTGVLSGGAQGDLSGSPKIYELEDWRWTRPAAAGQIAELRVGTSQRG